MMRLMISDLKPDAIAQENRVAISRVAAAAQRLRKISELYSLKENPVVTSVNTDDLLQLARESALPERS